MSAAQVAKNTKFEVMTEISPLGDQIGAEVEGFDLNNVTDKGFAEIRDALWQHLVLRFRGQDFQDEAHLALNARFGQLDYTPEKLIRGEDRIPGQPYMEVVSNIVTDGKKLGALGNHELVWHSDMSFLKRPYGVSILRSIELPSDGGDTSFANMFAALDAMPRELRARIEGRSTSQDGFLDTKEGNMTGEVGAEPERVENQYDGTPGVHPLVRTHPETGRKYLYLGRRPRSSIVGLSEQESEALLDQLWAHATQPQFTWTQIWALGDVILWDNRCTLHHRTEFDPTSRRILRRTATLGEVPH